MEKNFKPMMAAQVEEQFTNILMNGDGIRKDNGGHDFFEVIPRASVRVSNGGVGCSGYEQLQPANKILSRVILKLEKEGYIVLQKPCSDSYKGRFKASVYYLASE